MGILLDCQTLEKGFGGRSLFRALNFGVFDGDRIGLIGRNGSGKSTLLRILAGDIDADHGQIIRRTYLKVAYVAQSDDYPANQSIAAVLRSSPNLAGVADADLRVAKICSQTGLDDPDKLIGELSGGFRKRVSIAEALLVEPDLMLLDEPTNHLDIDNVLWLESILKRASFTWIMVSHDRQFLENTVTKVAELATGYDNGIFFSEGGYEKFLENRATYFQARQAQADSMANRMRTEDEWLKRGPKARTTKARARIDQAEELRTALAKLQNQLQNQGHVFDFSASGRKTRKLAELNHVLFAYDDAHQYGPFDLVINNGLKLGLLGRNGSGKTTLMKLITKKLQPNAGKVRHTDGLRVIYFDQKRESVDESLTLKFALAEDGQQVIYNEKPMHVITWAKKFMFSPEQMDTPVSTLSGGEKAKVILARLMHQPADLLALDEPTNDLDIDALETLEDSLNQFPGAVILISHDRYFLESVCNYFLGFDQNSALKIYNDFDHWVRETKPTQTKSKEVKKEVAKGKPKPERKRLSYMEQREYDQMEEKIMQLETDVDSAQTQLELPEVMQDLGRMAEAAENYQSLKNQLDAMYQRWAELESKLES